MKKHLRLIYSSIFIFLVSITILLITDIKFGLVIFFLAMLVNAYHIYKEKVGHEIVVAFLFALIITSYYVYEYTTNNIMVGKINLFPLVSWTFGLVLLREIYINLHGSKKSNFIKISLLYLLGLFIVEYLGYHLLNIQLNSNYPDLFNLGVIHAPLGMKLFYLLAGPVYILIIDYLLEK